MVADLRFLHIRKELPCRSSPPSGKQSECRTGPGSGPPRRRRRCPGEAGGCWPAPSGRRPSSSPSSWDGWAATGSYQVMVDIEKDAKYIPAFLKGERTLFLAQGSVDAGVDFSGLGPGAVTVNPDHSVTISLPHATLSKPVLDTDASHVVDRDRGLLDRIGSVFSDSPTGEQGLYAAAEPKLRAAADESALVAKADQNTTAMLQKFLGALGYDHVNVAFQDNPA